MLHLITCIWVNMLGRRINFRSNKTVQFRILNQTWENCDFWLSIYNQCVSWAVWDWIGEMQAAAQSNGDRNWQLVSPR